MQGGFALGDYMAIVDNTQQALSAIESGIKNGLTGIGMTMERYAIEKCPVDTGNLRRSITFAIDENAKMVTCGTNTEYAPYVELGTGIYYAGGRQDSWVYQDAKGNWHKTNGQKPQPFLKPAGEEHTDEYRQIFINAMQAALGGK